MRVVNVLGYFFFVIVSVARNGLEFGLNKFINIVHCFWNEIKSHIGSKVHTYDDKYFQLFIPYLRCLASSQAPLVSRIESFFFFVWSKSGHGSSFVLCNQKGKKYHRTTIRIERTVRNKTYSNRKQRKYREIIQFVACDAISNIQVICAFCSQ